MLSYEEALKTVLNSLPPVRSCTVRTASAFGLVLAKAVRARRPLPSFQNTAVDGYALSMPHAMAVSNDLAQGPLSFRVAGVCAAGSCFPRAIRRGEAVRVLTGSAIPKGADRVVMQERIRRVDNEILVNVLPRPGEHIRRRGEDIALGEEVLEAGAELRAGELGVLAALGCDRVSVTPKPKVAVLSTGDELCEPGKPLHPGKIYESNSVLLGSLVREAGAHPVRMKPVRDELRALMASIRHGLISDVLVISGGVSVGDRDKVRPALKACGVKERFWRVSIKPGMPIYFGRFRKTLVFGLPGNPISAYVGFQEFVKPALQRLRGLRWQDPYAVPGRLEEDVSLSASRRTHFLRVSCVSRGDEVWVRTLSAQGSHQLSGLVKADGWIRLDQDRAPWKTGARVWIRPQRPEMFPFAVEQATERKRQPIRC